MDYSFFVDFSTAPKVHISTIIFYIVYLAIMWPLAISMYRNSRHYKHVGAKNLSIANCLLVTGDSAMFICWLLVYFNNPSLSAAPSEGMLPVVPIGIFSTSITMSLYYLYLVFFYRNTFLGGKSTLVIMILLVLFFARILLHYNPANIWLNMDVDKSTPNYTAWLRNIPLFLYGLITIVLILRQSTNPKFKSLRIAMIALLFSFLFYAVDIFFSHLIPNKYIWMTYTFKTIAYIIAAFQMKKYIKSIPGNLPQFV